MKSVLLTAIWLIATIAIAVAVFFFGFVLLSQFVGSVRPEPIHFALCLAIGVAVSSVITFTLKRRASYFAS